MIYCDTQVPLFVCANVNNDTLTRQNCPLRTKLKHFSKPGPLGMPFSYAIQKLEQYWLSNVSGFQQLAFGFLDDYGILGSNFFN